MSFSDIYLMALGPILALVAGSVIYGIAISDRSARRVAASSGDRALEGGKGETR